MQREVTTLLKKHAKPFAVLLATGLAILALSFSEMRLEFSGAQFTLRIEARR